MLDLKHFKNKLEEEKKHLEKSLSLIAQPNPQNPDDWETKPEDNNAMMADITEVADIVEEMSNAQAMETTLEDRLNEVKAALKRVEDGTYGKCKVKNCFVEKDRLEVDPAAATCVKHADRI